MTDADLITALRARGWTDCADAIEAGQQLEPEKVQLCGALYRDQHRCELSAGHTYSHQCGDLHWYDDGTS